MPSGHSHYLRQLLTQAFDTSGGTIEVEKRDVVEFDSQIEFASAGDASHRLVVSRAYQEHLDHFFAGAALKIIRFYEQPSEERYLPALTHSGLPRRELLELRGMREWRSIPSRTFESMTQFLYEGTVRQLTSYPMDLRVEREIAERFPEHRILQEAYLHRQVRDFERAMNRQMQRVFPKRTIRATQAMNMVFAEEAAEITGSVPGRLCSSSPYRDLASVLRRELHRIETKGAAGDRALTDTWAKALNLRSWYEWKRVDENS